MIPFDMYSVAVIWSCGHDDLTCMTQNSAEAARAAALGTTIWAHDSLTCIDTLTVIERLVLVSKVLPVCAWLCCAVLCCGLMSPDMSDVWSRGRLMS